MQQVGGSPQGAWQPAAARACAGSAQPGLGGLLKLPRPLSAWPRTAAQPGSEQGRRSREAAAFTWKSIHWYMSIDWLRESASLRQRSGCGPCDRMQLGQWRHWRTELQMQAPAFATAVHSWQRARIQPQRGAGHAQQAAHTRPDRAPQALQPWAPSMKGLYLGPEPLRLPQRAPPQQAPLPRLLH